MRAAEWSSGRGEQGQQGRQPDGGTAGRYDDDDLHDDDLHDDDLHDDDLVVQIVAMRRRHLRAVLRIEAQVYPRPWSTGLYLSELALRSTRAYYVARVRGTIVAYGGLMLAAEDGHITTLAVDPQWHRRKMASRLLLVLARDAVRNEVTSLTLEVRVSNTAAQELYRQFGFAPAGVRKRYYVETNEDALVMWAHDVDKPGFRRRLAAIEATIPGRTLFEGSILQ